MWLQNARSQDLVSALECEEMQNCESGEKQMLTRTIDVKEKLPDLKGLLSLVADGTEVVLTEGSTPIARLVPIGKRVAGLHAGSIWTSADFDESLPDEFWSGNA
jgi:antitoxin (DNA-binding transcriptional repressor) of toxin-antitoxin stability system